MIIRRPVFSSCPVFQFLIFLRCLFPFFVFIFYSSEAVSMYYVVAEKWGRTRGREGKGGGGGFKEDPCSMKGKSGEIKTAYNRPDLFYQTRARDTGCCSV